MPRTLIILLALGVCLYSGAIVWCALETSDIGIFCAFDTEIQQVDSARIRIAGGDSTAGPRDGDTLVAIGGREIATWSDYLRTLSLLKGETTWSDRLRSLGLFEPEPQLARLPVPADLPLEQLSDISGSNTGIVQRGAEELVHVAYRRPGDPDEAAARTAWCLVAPPSWTMLAHSLVWFLVKMALFAVVTVALWKRPQDKALTRFFLLCVVTIGAYMGGYHWLRIATALPLVPVFMVCAVLLPAVSFHFYLVFPRPKAFVVRHPVATIFGVYGLTAVTLVAMLTTYLLVVWAYRGLENAELVRSFSRLLVNEIYLALAVAPCLFLGCVLSLAHSYVTTVPGSRERNQVKWILLGAILATLPIAYTLFLAVTATERFGVGGAATPMFIASLCFTLAYGVSISRYGLMDVDKVLNWGIVSIGVSVAAGIFYFVLVFLGTLVIGSQLEPLSPFRQAAWVSITALLLLLLLDLLRWRIRKATGRRLHRERYQLDKTLRRMSDAVEQLVDPPTLCRRLLQALEELLGFRQGAIYLREGEPPVFRLASHVGVQPSPTELPTQAPLVDACHQSPMVRLRRGPAPQPEPAQRQLQALGGEIALPLRHEGKLMAVLLVGPRTVGDYDVEELHLLTTFAQLAALGLHGARGHQTIEALNRELRGKVEKISEQQRRILVLQNQLLRQNLPEGPNVPGEEAAESPERAGIAEATSVAPDIVGSSLLVQQLLNTVRKVAASPSAVLIRGESGTGKELLARALHNNSARADGPFVKVHCAALSSSLLESELFGHVKGAFTGAHKDKVGRFELANGGTLFLDEIGDITLEVQTKLLRVLQEMMFERVGSSEPIRVDVRIIAATHQDLEVLMKTGRFREDLFYRLNVITIRTPALRERREDIYELALHFLRVFRQRSGKRISHVEEEALETLKAYDWPGNIRELENVIERAVVLAEGSSLTLRELPEELVLAANQGEQPPRTVLPSQRQEPVGASPSQPPSRSQGLTAPEPEWSAHWEERERNRLLQALDAASGNKTRAARALGMPRSTFLSKLEKHGLLARRG